MAKNVYDLSEDIFLPEPEDETKKKKRRLTPKQRNYAIGLPILGVCLICIGLIYYFAANVWLIDYATIDYLTFAYSTTTDGSKSDAQVVAINGSSNYPSVFRIPSEINGHKVTSIADGAFVGASRLKKVIMTDNIVSIGSRAFANCTELENFVFSKNIESIGSGAFENTAFEANWPDDEVVVVGDILLSVGKDYFEPNSIILKDRDSTIPSEYANSPVYYFSEIADVNQWMEGIFDGNENLVFVEMPSYLEIIPNESFQNCYNLEGVAFPDNVSTIGEYAFANCSNLVDAYVPSTVTTYGAYSFKNTSANIAADMSHVTSIGEGAFQNCLGVTNVIYPNISVPQYAFDGCSNLTDFEFVDANPTITSIGFAAFRGTSLTEFVFPQTVSSIDDYVLANCEQLETVYMYDNGPVRINAYAFYGSKKFDSLLLLNDNGAILERCTDLNTVYIPSSVTSTANALTSSRGYIFSGTDVTRVEFPSSIITIGQNIFAGLSSLEEVVFLKDQDGKTGLTTIETGAFSDCVNLRRISLPESLTTLNTLIFSGCTSLTEVVFEGNPSIRTLPVGLFQNCSSLTSVKLPSSFSRMNANAFAGTTSLEYLYIPSTISTIEAGAVSKVRTVEGEKMPIYVELTESAYEAKTTIKDGWYDDTCALYLYSETAPEQPSSEYAGYWHYDNDGNIAVWDI